MTCFVLSRTSFLFLVDPAVQRKLAASNQANRPSAGTPKGSSRQLKTPMTISTGMFPQHRRTQPNQTTITVTTQLEKQRLCSFFAFQV